MVLHFVLATTNSPSGSGTEDTLSSTAFTPSGENEIQERIGTMPQLIGYHGFQYGLVSGAATLNQYYKLQMNTWQKAQYIISHWDAYRHEAVASGAQELHIPHPQPHWVQPLALDRDADWDIKIATLTASVDASVALYLSYGARIPAGNGMRIHRKVSASSDLSADTWDTIGTISDLDPRKTYRVSGIQGFAEDQPLIAVRVTSPSNNTYAGVLCAVHTTSFAGSPMIYLPIDSIVVSGVSTLTVEGYVGGASKPSALIEFEEYSVPRIARLPPGIGGRGGGRGGTLAGAVLGAAGSALLG